MQGKTFSYLFQLGKGKRVTVLCSELHEPHVGRVGQLCDNAEAGEEPKMERDLLPCSSFRSENTPCIYSLRKTKSIPVPV